MALFARPICPLFNPSAIHHLFQFPDSTPSSIMRTDPQDGSGDTFVVSSATALTVGEQLLFIMNTVAQNLPESELCILRDSLSQSLALADDLLYNFSLSSRLDVLTINDGTYVVSSVFVPFLYLHLTKVPLLPSAAPPTLLGARATMARLPPEFST